MGMAIVFRLIGAWGLWQSADGSLDRYYLYTQLLLPVISCILFSATVLLLGKRALWVSTFAVLPGVIFFVFRILYMYEHPSAEMTVSLLQVVLCILLYLVVLTLWGMTVFYRLRTKWLLAAVFGLPFLYHVCIEDAKILRTTEVSFRYGMQEISVLLIMLAMLLVALAMKKRKPNILDGPLPKMKAPVITGVADGPAHEADHHESASENNQA